jgi:hypothetical protein
VGHFCPPGAGSRTGYGSATLIQKKDLRGVAGGVVLVEKRRHVAESPEQLVSFGTATTVLSQSNAFIQWL